MLPSEIAYAALLFGLFVVPKALQRYRIPAAITSLAIGLASGPGLGLFEHDETIKLLATFGIVALFLFAGLDVDLGDLRRERRILGEHLVVRVATLGLGAWVVAAALGIEPRAALVVALALLTPSTGFILDSLPSMGLDDRTAFWVRTKAIATELVALAVMFVTLQSASWRDLSVSSVVLVAMILVLPIGFRAFAYFIVPHAPKTEFSFLLMTAVICALVTRQLGVYYLVGAFIVGMVAQSFRSRLPAIANERMLGAVEAFASIFVPFYFFHAGLVLRREDVSVEALAYGLAFIGVALPVRVGLVSLHRWLRLGEPLRDSLKVAIPMLPTLVFTLVLAEILRDQFEVPAGVFGGLVVYALVNTIVPSFVFKTPPPEFESPEILPLTDPPAADA